MVSKWRRNEGDDKRFMNSFIPYGKQWIDEKDIQAVIEVLK